MLINAQGLALKYSANMNSVSEALIGVKPVRKEATSANRRPCMLYDERAAATALIDLYVARHDKHRAEAKRWLKLAEEAAQIRGTIKDED